MENWRPVVGHEGAYEVSDLGRVRSLERKVRCRGGAFRTSPPKILAPGRMNEFGHLSVAIGKGNSKCVHDLVLTAFVEPRPQGQEARHRDLNGSNNKLGNLSWGTRGQNIRDVMYGGGRKVTEDEIKEIRIRRGTGEFLKRIGEDYGISESHVWSICHRRAYPHVD